MSELPIRYWILNLKNIILVVFTTRLYSLLLFMVGKMCLLLKGAFI